MLLLYICIYIYIYCVVLYYYDYYTNINQTIISIIIIIIVIIITTIIIDGPLQAGPWGNTNRVVSNRVVSKGPLYPSKTNIIRFVYVVKVRTYVCIIINLLSVIQDFCLTRMKKRPKVSPSNPTTTLSNYNNINCHNIIMIIIIMILLIII